MPTVQRREAYNANMAGKCKGLFGQNSMYPGPKSYINKSALQVVLIVLQMTLHSNFYQSACTNFTSMTGQNKLRLVISQTVSKTVTTRSHLSLTALSQHEVEED